MTTPFNYSVSSFVISNINDTENDSDNDFGDENISNQEEEEESEFSFPTDLDTNTLESDFDDAEAADVVSLNSPFLTYDSSEENDASQNSLLVDSDTEVEDDSTAEDSKRITVDNETNHPESDEEPVDDDQKCPICLAAWTNVGSHRLSSLRCGHLFGYKCIKQWLKSNNQSSKKCPQCNAKASLKHIRFIYANKLISIDNSELEEIKKKIDKNKEIIKKISKALSKQKKRARKYKEMCKNLKTQV